MKTLMGTTYINELLAILKNPASNSDAISIAAEDILSYVQNLENIAVRLAIYIASDDV